MFRTFNLNLDILATVWATFPDIGQIFVQFSGHSESGKDKYLSLLLSLAVSFSTLLM
jgi:hypothetical protein